MTLAQNVWLAERCTDCKIKINEQYEESVDSLNGIELWKNTHIITTKNCYFLILPADTLQCVYWVFSICLLGFSAFSLPPHHPAFQCHVMA